MLMKFCKTGIDKIATYPPLVTYLELEDAFSGPLPFRTVNNIFYHDFVKKP